MNFDFAFPIAGVVVLVVVFAVIFMAARLYKKVSPNVAAVVTGRNHKHTVVIDGVQKEVTKGFRVITGGGFILIPIVEKMENLSLNAMPLEISATGPDKNGAIVKVDAIANVKILSEAMMLPLAVERFLGMDQKDIESLLTKTLEGNLRAIISTMAIEELIKSREDFAQASFKEAGGDLAKLGVGIDNLKIQNLSDPNHYIESLGKKQTAEVVKDAAVGQAEAQRETNIKTAAAEQAGKVAQAEAAKAISDAERVKDMAIADNDAQVQGRQAQIEIAAKIAAADRTKDLNTALVDAEKAKAKAETELMAEQALRNAAELDATIVTSAKKEKEAKIIAGEAEQAFATLTGEASRIKAEKAGQGEKAKAEGEAEASRIRAEKAGQGEQAKMTAEAEGRKAAASALQAEREAAAAGERAELLAKAAGKEADLLAVAKGTQAQLLATAAGTQAQLLAEAEGVLKKAEAFKQLDDAGRFLMILQSLPPVIEAVGFAAEKALTPAAQAIGTGLGNVKEMRIIDMGGANGSSGGKNIIGQFVNLPVETIFGLVEKLKASGLMPVVESVLKKNGIDLESVMKSVASTSGTEAVPAAESTSSSKASK